MTTMTYVDVLSDSWTPYGYHILVNNTQTQTYHCQNNLFVPTTLSQLKYVNTEIIIGW